MEKCAVSASEDRTTAAWNVEAGYLIVSFEAGSRVLTCTVGSDELTFIAGDTQGCVHFLRLENGA
jgi:hypothetical protein